MASVETLILEIIARDKNASAAFDNLRRSVDGSTGSVDKNTSSLQKNTQAQTSAMGAAIGVGTAFSAMTSPIASAGSGIVAFGALAAPSIKAISTAISKPGGLQANMALLDSTQQKMAGGILALSARYHGLAMAMEPRDAQILGTALGLVNKSLGPFDQLAVHAGTALEGFLVQFSQQAGLSQFITFMSKEAGPAITLLGTDITNISHAVFSLLESWGGVGLTELKAVTVVISGISGSLVWLSTHAPGITAAAIAIGGVALALSKLGLLTNVLKITGILAATEAMQGFAAATRGATLAEKGMLATTTALDAINPLVWVGLAAISVGVLVDKIVTYRGSVADLTAELAKQDHANGLNVAGYQKLAAALGGVTSNQAEFFQVMDKGRGAQNGQVDVTNALADAQQKAAQRAATLRGDFSVLSDQYGVNTDQVKTLIIKSGALNDILAHNGRITPVAAQKIADYAASENKATGQTNLMANAITALTDDLNKNVTAVLTLQGDQLAWQSAMQAANKQLSSNNAGLKGNTANAIANRQAVLAGTTAAVAFAKQQLATKSNLSGASDEIQKQIKYLKGLHDQTGFTKTEIQALVGWLKQVKSEQATITVSGTGSYTIAAPGTLKRALGGMITGGIPGQDSVPILAMPGEVVIPTSMVRSGAVDHLRGQLPGFASGGVVGHYGDGVPGLTGFLRTENAATMKAIENATAAAIFRAIRKGPAALINFAEHFLGVPYVWGGTSPVTGWDCSGFTSFVYNHFGYGAPRTSEMQQAWARPSGDVPGALAFFFGTGGTASHVGINLGHGKMINAEHPGSLTMIDNIFSGFSGFGIPPQGFDQGGWLMPGQTGINRTSRPERVTSARGEDAMLGRLDAVIGLLGELIGAVDQNSGDTAAGVARVLGGAAKSAHYASLYGA